jgi:ABC-type amino acid transport substrate-binding protein
LNDASEHPLKATRKSRYGYAMPEIDTNSSQISTTARVADPQPARFVDVIVLVLLFIVGLTLFSFSYYHGIADEVRGAERSVRSLREKDATLQEKLENTIALAELNAADARVAHPALPDRDANFIGDHADVAWSYDTNGDSKYFSYELEIWRNVGGNCTSRRKGEQQLYSANHDFWKGCSNGPIKLIATDPTSLNSRIPPDLDNQLQAGRYSWRVAPIRAGSSANPPDDDTELLADWSELSTFTIYRSLLDRIVQTGEVRVGTNFEQDTHFSRRNESGQEDGFDIALIQILIEDCLKVEDGLVSYDYLGCARGIAERKKVSYGRKLGETCHAARSSSKLCVNFVSIGSWGGWQPLLKRKEIDVFIGSVTRASARERSGVVFTDGYLNYQTKLYANRMDLEGVPKRLNSWLNKERVVGVIEHSTNETLLDALIATDGTGRLNKLTFPSYPALESAMEQGIVDGLIVDDTFVSDNRTDWVSLDDLNATKAWQKYMLEFIGRQFTSRSGAEQIAIATIREASGTQTGLYSALQTALKQREVRTELLPDLCRAFWKHSDDQCIEATKP